MDEIVQRLLWLLARRAELTEDLAGVDREVQFQRGRLAEAQARAAAERVATAAREAKSDRAAESASS